MVNKKTMAINAKRYNSKIKVREFTRRNGISGLKRYLKHLRDSGRICNRRLIPKVEMAIKELQEL